MLSLTFKNLWARKWRSLMTAVAVIFGIALVAGTYILTDTTNQAFDQIFNEANKGTDVVITAKSEVDQQDGSTPAFSAKVLKEVQKVEGVRAAAGGIFSTGAILDANDDSTGGGFAPQFISSVQPKPFNAITYVDGGPPEGPREATLDKEAADRSNLEVGDTIKLIGVGKAVPFKLVGTTQLGSGSSFGGTSVADVELPVAQKITGKVGEFDQISVAADSGVSATELRDRIEKVVPTNVRVETAQENADRNASEIRDSLQFLTIALLAFAAIALFVGSFVIFNVFSITVAQRTREFGMLRTLGASRRQILVTVLIEGLIIGLVGSIIGLFVGYGLAAGLSAVLKAVGADLPANSLQVLTRTIVVSLVIGVGVTVVSSVIPAIRSTRVPPIAALSENLVVGGKNRVVVRTVIAVLLGIIGLLLIASTLIAGTDGGTGAARIGGGAVCALIAISIFAPKLVAPAARVIGAPLEKLGGLTGRLARENAQRNPSRTAVTAAALMIGLALIAFVTIFASGLSSSVNKVIEDQLPGEITLQGPGGVTSFPAGAVDAVRGVDGVEAASGVRYVSVKIDGKSAAISSVDPADIVKVYTVEWKDGTDSDLTSLTDKQIVLGDSLADELGVGVGDSVKLTSQTGGEFPFEVNSIMKTGSISLAGEAIINQVAMGRDFNQPLDAVGLIKLDPGADLEKTQTAIEDVLKKQDFPTVDVLNQGELKEQQKAQINGLLAMIYVLLALAVVVSLVGIVVTLILSIYERTRELGMLRAIGMSRRQVKRMVRYEAVITAVIGAVSGLVVGVIFAFLIGIPLGGDGFELSYPIPTLIVILILTALAGVIAAIYPARKAAKLDVLEAVSYE